MWGLAIVSKHPHTQTVSQTSEYMKAASRQAGWRRSSLPLVCCQTGWWCDVGLFRKTTLNSVCECECVCVDASTNFGVSLQSCLWGCESEPPFSHRAWTTGECLRPTLLQATLVETLSDLPCCFWCRCGLQWQPAHWFGSWCWSCCSWAAVQSSTDTSQVQYRAADLWLNGPWSCRASRVSSWCHSEGQTTKNRQKALDK